ncbi:MAG TPA: class I SAM-dependent methyltransferase [Ignavibacteria bacterium]|nr:class I SAM-dependent methyltransferase [Ignavibacteria bacterium]HMQ98049.1 class I SAM-dependent methyltransferase [Ignavibacteria bacterium]
MKDNGYVVAKGSSILDVGCGLGYHCQNMLKFDLKESMGVDISKETIELIGSFNTKPVFRTLDICNDDISEYIGKFDIIFSSDVYEHVDDPDLMLQNLHKLLKEGGVISITFPNWLHHGQNQFQNADDFKAKLLSSGFSNAIVKPIEDYGFLYKIFMKLYTLAQLLSDKVLSVKRVEFQGSGMPESDEFHEMYAYKKISKLKKYKVLCIVINVMYRIIASIINIRPPYIEDKKDPEVLGKRIIVYAQKSV